MAKPHRGSDRHSGPRLLHELERTFGVGIRAANDKHVTMWGGGF